MRHRPPAKWSEDPDVVTADINRRVGFPHPRQRVLPQRLYSEENQTSPA